MPSSPVESRLERLEKEVGDHRRDDEGQFAALRGDIAKLGKTLGDRMDEMRDGLQSQIDSFTEDKVRAEGKAEGLAEGIRNAAAARMPKWWLPLATTIGVVFLSSMIGLIGWMGSTIWSMEQEKITAAQQRPTAAVTVNPAPPANPTPIAVSPTAPVLPAPPAADDAKPPVN